MTNIELRDPRALVDRIRRSGEMVTRVKGGWVTRCPCCGVADELFIVDLDEQEDLGRPS